MAWRLQFTEDASEPMAKIEANRVVPALSRGIITAALISALLAANEVEPDWLGKWWVITVATIVGCNWTTKIEGTFQPMALWHKFTKGKYKP